MNDSNVVRFDLYALRRGLVRAKYQTPEVYMGIHPDCGGKIYACTLLTPDPSTSKAFRSGVKQPDLVETVRYCDRCKERVPFDRNVVQKGIHENPAGK